MLFIGCNFESRASQVGLHKCVSKEGKSELTGFLIYSQKLECLEFIAYEVVARSVASRPKKNGPLATKLLRSTCKYVACLSKSFRKCC